MKRTSVFLLLIFLAAAGLQNVAHAASSPSPSPALRILRDLSYVPNGSPRQRLDLYLPQQPGATRPLVAFIHGGSWRTASKELCRPEYLVPLGYAVASIDYRFSQDAIFPAQIEDCKAAIRWFRAHSAEYGIDPNHIGVWGSSAGGHLVALLGVTGQIRDFDVGANLDQSSAVQCVLDFFGPTDFLHYSPVRDLTDESPHSAVPQLLGGLISTHQAEARRASPVYYVTRDAAPFLIVHGGKDPTVPLQQSQELDSALEKAGVECTLHVLPGEGHDGPRFYYPEVHKLIADFFDHHLKTN